MPGGRSESMTEEVLINVGLGEIRVAVLEEGKPVEFVLERTSEDDLKEKTGRAGHSLLGNIFYGRVQRVLPGMQAAFVDVGLQRAGFLGAREAKCLCELTGLDEGTLPPISSCVTEGQSILVQATKDPIGEKGVRLSANVTLPGRLLVMVPNQSGVVMSRRIEDEAERERLSIVVSRIAEKLNALGVTGEPAGFIVRTAAIGMEEAALEEDARRLAADWAEVRAAEKNASPPDVLFHDLDPVAKTMRDFVSMDTARVELDDAKAYQEAVRYCNRAMPHMAQRVSLVNGPGSVFDEHDIDGVIEQALDPRFELPSGGWITIETTEALTAIDVNSGRYTASTGLEETSVRTNIEAAEAIVDQVRLRGTGGLIVIDFIHMNDPANIEKVLDTLNKGFEKDRVPTQVSTMSEFGLVEMTRKRVREPLEKLLTEPIYGDGRARVKTRATVANELLRAIDRVAARYPGAEISARAAPGVISWLEGSHGRLVRELETRVAGTVYLEPMPGFDREQIDVGPAR
jgi:ribonuclease G